MNSRKIVRLKSEGYIIGCWKKSIIEGLEEIFENIFVIDCTEIIEPFSVFEELASFGIKFSGNSYNGEMNSFFPSGFFNGFYTFIDATIANIR